ncbi:kinesin-2b isoform X1 [Hydra vulgaris]|uniref:kinesin-2b isoform X1 n=1 Tax=Hydra vulgaris TaxID=6087 RepID=UPI0006416979|nr:kinesin-like protein klp-20 [Hydra vulgaris]
MPEGSSIQVAVRCRPLSTSEKNSGATRVLKIKGDQVSLHNAALPGSSKEISFSYENCYFTEAKNNEIFKDLAEPLLRKALDGYNISVIAFGQHDSGKSHTINGTLEDPGLISRASETIFKVIEDASNVKDYFLMVSMLEVGDSFLYDLINPSGIDLKVRHHPQLGLYVDDIAEVVVQTNDDVIRLCDQGLRIRKLTTDINGSARTTTVFSIYIEQRAKGGSQFKSTKSTISFIELAGSEHTSKSEDAPFISKSLNSLRNVVMTLKQGTKVVPYEESKLTKLLQVAFGGNGYTVFIGHVSPSDGDFSETFATLQFMSHVKSVQNIPKRNQTDYTMVIKGLREEISKLRERLSINTGKMVDTPNNDDVSRMEELIKDLQLAKMQTWEEKQRMSEMFLEERKHHLSSKGILDWVLDSMKKGSKDVQSKLANLQKDKERLMIEYKEVRNVADALKDQLQLMITEYTKLNEAGNGNSKDGKQKVAEIQEMKEKLRQENETLKKIKQNLKEIQDKQKLEKEEAKNQAASLKGNFELRFKLEAENRENMEKENQATLADEIDRVKMETENEKAELKMKSSGQKLITADDLLKVEMELLDLKAEKSTMAVKLRSIESEKRQLKIDIDEMFKRQKEELEIQQLQHFQTFRNYREAFEEQKGMLEQRYRALLEDSIQDAVYLSSRNQELVDENQTLKQEIAELKDKISTISGRPQST